MSSRFESFELRNSRDKHAPQDDLPPPYTPYSPGISQSSLFLGLYLVIPGLIIASTVSLGFKLSVATKSTSDARPGQWLDKDGVTMAQWPSTLFPNQDELPLAVAALALATAVFTSILLLFVKRKGPIQASFSKRLAVLVHLGLTGGLALAGTIYAFVLNNRSTGFEITYAISKAPQSGTFTYDRGSFSKESWACTVSALPHFDADLDGAMSKTCSLELGSRWLTLFIFLLSVALFTLLYLDSRGGKYFMR